MADDKQKTQDIPAVPAPNAKTGSTGQMPAADAKKGATGQLDAQRGATGQLAAQRAKKKADPEQQRLKKEEQNRTARRRNRQLIGFALTILIIVGAVSIVRSGIDLVGSVLNSEEERLEYQKRFEPLVWFNILPFDSVSQVDENSIKQAAIWGVVNTKQDQLERNERGELLIPASEVDQYATAIFGPDFRFSRHEAFVDPVENLTYGYDGDTTMYIMPVTSQQFDYLATVVEIQRESGGVKRVVMGYVSTRTGDDQVVATPDYDHPTRFMDFMLRRDGTEYYLYAIQRNTTHIPEAASSGAASVADEAPPEEEDETPASDMSNAA